jgi:hypothetical protein
MKPGDVAYLRGGMYVGNFEIRSSGKRHKPLEFRSYPGERAVVQGPVVELGRDHDTVRIYGHHVVLDDLAFANDNVPAAAVWIAFKAHHVTISNSEVFESGGILISGNRNRILNNDVHDNGAPWPPDNYFGGIGIYVEGGWNKVRGNAVYSNHTGGIAAYRGRPGVRGHNVIVDNYVYANGIEAASDPRAYTYGIALSGEVDGIPTQPANEVRHNRVCGNGGYGIALDFSPRNAIRENITCHNSLSGFVLVFHGRRNTSKRNISYSDGEPALIGTDGLQSDHNTYFSPSRPVLFRWDDVDYASLTELQSATAQEAHSALQDPLFANVPAAGFDPGEADSYDFCNAVLTSFC